MAMLWYWYGDGKVLILRIGRMLIEDKSFAMNYSI